MTKITFIEHQGNKHEVDGSDGDTLMQLAVDNEIPGIDADCGGGCACGTCHVFIDKKWLAKLEEPDPEEDSMLNMTPDRADESRLACQISINEHLDGLVVTLPEFQM